FAYVPGRPALQNVTFEATPGSHIAIAGTTGAGKTTLVSLLMRFYDPAAGRIELDGVDLRDLRLADLRRQFAIVLQEPLLFSTSIAENIAYARPDATEAQIEAAARAAHAHEFVSALPDSYGTLVGERGVRLSGGERQRISLARAFLKDAPVLILDEATSSVDVRTEALIVDAMQRLMRGRTTFMIAHRLSTLADCDLQLQIEEGRIAGVGLPGPRTNGQRRVTSAPRTWPARAATTPASARPPSSSPRCTSASPTIRCCPSAAHRRATWASAPSRPTSATSGPPSGASCARAPNRSTPRCASG